MPDLLDMARQAFEKARLFGGGFAEDFGTQLGETPEKLGHLQDRPAPFMPPQVDAAMKIMGLIPQVEQSVSSGLGRAGMPGGKEFGLNVPDSPLGEISIGPREGLGMIAGLAIPGGEAGEMGSIARKLTSKMGPGAQRLAAKSAERAASKAVPEAEKLAAEMGKVVGNPPVPKLTGPSAARAVAAERAANGPYLDRADMMRRNGLSEAQVDQVARYGHADLDRPPVRDDLSAPESDDIDIEIDPKAISDIGSPPPKMKTWEGPGIKNLPTPEQEAQASRAYDMRPPPPPAVRRAEDLPVDNEGVSEKFGSKPRGQRPPLPRGPYPESHVWGDELADYAAGHPKDQARLEARYPGIKEEAAKYYIQPGESRASRARAETSKASESVQYPDDYVGGVTTPANFPTPEQWAESRNPKAPPPRPQTSDPRPGTEMRTHSLEQAKRDLSAAEYEGGYRNTELVLDADGNPVLPEGVLAPEPMDVAGLADVSESERWLGKRKNDSTSTEALTRIPSARGKTFVEGPSQFENQPVGPVMGGENLAQLAERRTDIGQRRTGSSPNTGGEKYLYDERNARRAQQLLDEELDPKGPTGGDPQNHPYFKDYINQIVYSPQSKMDSTGKVLYKKNPDGSPKMMTWGAEDAKQTVPEPEEIIQPLYKRVAEAEDLARSTGKRGLAWKTKQQIRPGEGPIKIPDTSVEGWHKTPEGAEWLRREAIAQITGPGGAAYRNYSPEQLAKKLVEGNALSRANAENFDNPLAVSTQQHKKPSKFNTDAFTDEGASTDPNDIGHEVRGSGGTAFESLGDLEAAGVNPNVDAFEKKRLRDIDKSSYDESQKAQFNFSDIPDEKAPRPKRKDGTLGDPVLPQQEFMQLAGDIQTNEKFLQKMSERKSHDFFEFSEKLKDGTLKKYRWNAEDMDRHARQATARIDAMRARQAELTGVSEYGPDAVRQGAGDTPDWEHDLDYITDTRASEPETYGMTKGGREAERSKDTWRRKPGTVPNAPEIETGAKPLDEGVTGTVHRFGVPFKDQTTTHTGEMPSIGMETTELTNPRTGLDPRQEEQILKRQFENMTPDERMALLSNSERWKASHALASSDLRPQREPFIAGPGTEGTNFTDYSTNPPGVVEGADPALRQEGRGTTGVKPATVGESTDYFKKKMAELMEAIPAVQQGRMVGNPGQRSAWEDYMQNKLAEMLRQR